MDAMKNVTSPFRVPYSSHESSPYQLVTYDTSVILKSQLEIATPLNLARKWFHFGDGEVNGVRCAFFYEGMYMSEN